MDVFENIIMIIIIGNQKGGAGKSTLTLLMANYLTTVKEMPVSVIDMDYQQSIYQKYEKAKVLENEEPYEVVPAGLELFPKLLPLLQKNKDSILLIDLPGKLDDDNLIPVITSADLILCPFSYDELTFTSTVFFALLVKKINPKTQIIFIPNRIKANVRYDQKDQMEIQLKNFGQISDPIMERVDFQRVNTQQTPLSVFTLIVNLFDQLVIEILRIQKTLI